MSASDEEREFPDSYGVSGMDMLNEDGDGGESENGLVERIRKRIAADGIIGFLQYYPVQYVLNWFTIRDLLTCIVLISKDFYQAVVKYEFNGGTDPNINDDYAFYRMEFVDILDHLRLCEVWMQSIKAKMKVVRN